ncbi:MAG TPA: trypsin-like peptidase domain-containing protein [Thermomicrobiales bacterium]
MESLLEQSVLGETLSAEIVDIARKVRESVVLIDRHGGNGAGVIWRADGRIVTNRHVVGLDRRVNVSLSDGRRFPGEVVARHPRRDVAVVQVPAEGLPAAEIGDSTTVRPGQLAIAVGHPFGFRDAVSAGIVVAAGQMATERGPRAGDLLQSDVMLAPGNSGGPLVDAHGRVIGINTMVAGRLSLAVPSQAVERFVAGERPGGRIAYIGVNGVVVALRGQDYPAGLLLLEIVDGAPADRAGLLVGDVIVAIGETIVTDQESVPAALLRLAPGEAVTIRVLRGGELREFVVVPTERQWSG